MEKKSRGIVKVWAEGIELKSKKIRLKVRCRLQGNKGNQERAVLTGLKGSLGLPPKKEKKKETNSCKNAEILHAFLAAAL